ncbi:hypothetical protein NEHOM01_0431 [Nematocida homosporus]|uniref:uncharacterized protein n=1 Tax=Nematocida homosporus TaxID=1912981 RepID=UPI00221E858D|nr:uncharacterized protein NEHOM01_0431 [Nematocida homosporus]KAI5184829.1 hypothetical protein NEHOM01_0431 [Nematocida homosporus]
MLGRYSKGLRIWCHCIGVWFSTFSATEVLGVKFVDSSDRTDGKDSEKPGRSGSFTKRSCAIALANFRRVDAAITAVLDAALEEQRDEQSRSPSFNAPADNYSTTDKPMITQLKHPGHFGQSKTTPNPALIARLEELLVISSAADHTWTEYSYADGQSEWVLELNTEAILPVISSNYNNYHVIGVWERWGEKDYDQCVEDLRSLRVIKSAIPVRILGLKMEYAQKAGRLLLLLMRVLDVPRLSIDWLDPTEEGDALDLEDMRAWVANIPPHIKRRPTTFHMFKAGRGRRWDPFFALVNESYTTQKKRLAGHK